MTTADFVKVFVLGRFGSTPGATRVTPGGRRFRNGYLYGAGCCHGEASLAGLSELAEARPITAWETVEFQVKGAKPPKKLVVELRQAVYFLSWHVVEFREEAL